MSTKTNKLILYIVISCERNFFCGLVNKTFCLKVLAIPCSDVTMRSVFVNINCATIFLMFSDAKDRETVGPE